MEDVAQDRVDGVQESGELNYLSKSQVRYYSEGWLRAAQQYGIGNRDGIKRGRGAEIVGGTIASESVYPVDEHLSGFHTEERRLQPVEYCRGE